MTKKDKFEAYGNLLKQEILVPMTKKNLQDTLVFEAPEPFPGFLHYYSDIPQASKPLYVYVVVKDHFRLESVIRASQKIQKKNVVNFNAAFASITLNNITYNSIRIRDLESYDHISILQKLYKEEGIEFEKYDKKFDKRNALIRLSKIFYLSTLDEGIYLDNLEKDIGYFVIDEPVEWADFIELTHQVRNNWDYSHFDAANGFIYRSGKIYDIVRIYNPNLNLEYLKSARQKYTEWMKIKKSDYQKL